MTYNEYPTERKQEMPRWKRNLYSTLQVLEIPSLVLGTALFLNEIISLGMYSYGVFKTESSSLDVLYFKDKRERTQIASETERLNNLMRACANTSFILRYYSNKDRFLYPEDTFSFESSDGVIK